MHARIQHGPPGVGAVETGRSEARGREEEIADGVARLHGGDDAKLREAGNVRRRDDLGVLNPPAEVSGRSLREGAVHRLQSEAVAAIADGVGGDLKSRIARLGEGGVGGGVLHQDEAAGLRAICIRFEQRRAARAESAVEIDFHRPRRNASGAADAGAVIRTGDERVEMRDIERVVDAQGELPDLGELLHDWNVSIGDRHVVHAGPAA